MLLIEQLLNGLQYGMTLFLMASGLTLVFGVMGLINLAHGSLYMVGAYLVASIAAASGSFWLGLGGGVLATAAVGLVLEGLVFRHLYRRDHLSQVLATFALLLMANEGVRMIWGAQPINLPMPAGLDGPVELLPGLVYPAYRLLIIAMGLAVAGLLYLLIAHTRIGMQVRAGASNPEMARAMATGANLLLLDEPSAGMNPKETREITRIIRRMRDEGGYTILLVEHKMNLVKEISDRVIVLDYGTKLAEGSYEDVVNDERVIEAYLGKRASEDAARADGLM